VGLNRPDKRNCFNPDVMRALLEAVARRREAKCGIVRPWRQFLPGRICAGRGKLKMGRPSGCCFVRSQHLFEAMARGNIPSSRRCGRRWAEDSRWLRPRIRVADNPFFAPPRNAHLHRRRRLGSGAAARVCRMQDMMLTGRVLKPDEAERYGIVQYVAQGQSMAKAKSWL
jgi:hypothetical protein